LKKDRPYNLRSGTTTSPAIILILIITAAAISGCAPPASTDQIEDTPEESETAEAQPEVTYMALTITSTAFENNKDFPSRYTCDGKDINPPLSIVGVPEGTQTLVLIVDDPDAPVGVWDHWVVWNIPAETTSIAEDSVPGVQGKNSWGRNDYGGPCPPSGTHRYYFKLYALDTKLDLDTASDKKAVEAAMKGHVLEEAELMASYSKQK